MTATKKHATRRGAKSNEARGVPVRAVARETTTMAAAALVSVDKPLTEKQKAFAKARARGETIPNAMEIAGYNEQPSYGYRMEKMPNIRRLIQEEQALYAEAAQIDRKQVIDMHLEAFSLAKLMAEPSSMVAAAREVGKIIGCYEPKKVDVTINGKVEHELHRMEGMTDAQLLEIIMNGGSNALPAPEEA